MKTQKVKLMPEAKLMGIAIREKSRASMIELEQADVTTQSGVSTDFRGRPGDRQVTLLSAESWQEACDELGKSLPWTTRRANLLLSGLPLASSQGQMVKIGDVVLRITGETDPCQRMDEQCPGLCGALEPAWRGGVCCRVVRGGTIHVGQTASIESSS